MNKPKTSPVERNLCWQDIPENLDVSIFTKRVNSHMDFHKEDFVSEQISCIWRYTGSRLSLVIQIPMEKCNL